MLHVYGWRRDGGPFFLDNPRTLEDGIAFAETVPEGLPPWLRAGRSERHSLSASALDRPSASTWRGSVNRSLERQVRVLRGLQIHASSTNVLYNRPR